MADGELGVFAEDTQFFSYYAIFANGQPWMHFNSSTTSYSTSRVYLTNPEIETEESMIAQGALELVLSRVAGAGIHEDLDITNHGLTAVEFNFEVVLRSDFADIFEVKAHHYVRSGHIETDWNERDRELSTTCTNRDFQRRFLYRVRNASSPPRVANGRITFWVELAPRETSHNGSGRDLSTLSTIPRRYGGIAPL